jgi:guanosine-3',5'-bis(diphosphate) 3'-pyrophosphohydrolase
VQELLRPSSQPKDVPPPVVSFDQFSGSARKSANGIQIVGQGAQSQRILYSYARCCNPIPGDNVVGIVTIGSGIKVHRASCRNVTDLNEKLKTRIVDLDWSSSETGEFLAAVKITGDDRPGMLNEITSAVISVQNTNIRGVNIDAFDSMFEGILTVFVRDLPHLQKIFDRLRKIKGIKSIERFEG